MQNLSADEIASVLITRLLREVQRFVAKSLIQDGTSADEVWSRFLENLNNGKTSTPEVGERPKNRSLNTRCSHLSPEHGPSSQLGMAVFGQQPIQ